MKVLEIDFEKIGIFRQKEQENKFKYVEYNIYSKKYDYCDSDTFLDQGSLIMWNVGHNTILKDNNKILGFVWSYPIFEKITGIPYYISSKEIEKHLERFLKMWIKKRTLEYFLTIFDKPSKKELEIIKDLIPVYFDVYSGGGVTQRFLTTSTIYLKPENCELNAYRYAEYTTNDSWDYGVYHSYQLSKRSKDFFLEERMKEYRLTGIFLENPTKKFKKFLTNTLA